MTEPAPLSNTTNVQSGASSSNADSTGGTAPALRSPEAQETFPGDGLPVEDRPLISPLAPMSTLRAEYENGSQTFVKQIDWLTAQGWIGIRRTRGDALAFAYIEHILNATEPALAVTTALSILETTQGLLEHVGFQRLVFEDFYEDFVNIISSVVNPREDGRLLTIASLLEAFNIPEVSNSVVMYLRMLTSAQIKAEADEFAPFLFNPETTEPMDPESFCNNFVEAFGKEADHVQITALSKMLKVNINVAYLDGHDTQGTVSFVPFQNAPDPDTEPINLLYRPGHYDILDRRSEDSVPPLLV
ncbi:cysteine proteinase [Trametes meyenii]|nr:cysteine proteinase [Trametes meyenii]